MMLAGSQTRTPDRENSLAPTIPSRLELAAEAYRRFHGRCFWHCPRELVVTESLIPFVERGLKTHGGHEGFRLASVLSCLVEPGDAAAACR